MSMQTSKKEKQQRLPYREKRELLSKKVPLCRTKLWRRTDWTSYPQSLEAMKNARSEVERLVKVRADHKLSISRANSVANELKELIKVLSLYNY